MDFNADIPFEKKAPAGFYDISDEKEREAAEKAGMTNVLLQKLEGKRRSEVEEEERKRDAKRLKLLKEKGDYVPPTDIRETAFQKSERRKLVLPAPQVGEAEIEELMKIGAAAESAKAIVDADGTTASSALLSDYSALNPASNAAATPLRTPRTPATSDTLKIQARNLRAMEQSQTPLLGDTVEVEGDSAYSFEPISAGGRKTMAGSSSELMSVHTPNPLASQLTPRAGVSGGQTPLTTPGSTASQRFATPVRDQIGINTPLRSEGFDETPGRGKQAVIREQLSSLFKTLPQPKNDFEIVVNETPEPSDEVSKTAPIEEDMADVEARNEAKRRLEEETKVLLRSSAVRRDLPRPLDIQPLPEDFDPDSGPEAMIRAEVQRMLLNDMANFPVPRQAPVPKPPLDAGETCTPGELEAARELILAELGGEHPAFDADEFERLHGSLGESQLFILPAASDKGGLVAGRFERSARASDEDRLLQRSRELDRSRDLMRREHARAQAIEKRLAVVLGGYMSRSTKLKRELAEQFRELEDGAIALESFRGLRVEEDVAATERVEALKTEVARVETRERELQGRYVALRDTRDRLYAAAAAATAGPQAENGAHTE
ncbi:CDC5 cell division cycle 5-like protein [Cladochytrium tenue]|nr:CDC5 cell division cycle 5-like protein [Cladochytrium tenue]